MGDDNITLGRQSFLQDGMEKEEDIHLLKEQHALHSLTGKRCSTANASQAQIQVNHLARGSNFVHMGIWRKQMKRIHLYNFYT